MSELRSMARAIEAAKGLVGEVELERMMRAAVKEGVDEAMALKESEADANKPALRTQILKILKNYRLLQAAHADKVYDLETLDAHPEAHFDEIDDFMRNVISKRDVRLQGVEKARARTHLSLANLNVTLNSYRQVCLGSELETERRRWRVLEARFLLDSPKSTRDIAEEENVTERTVQLDIQAAVDDLCVMLRGVDGLRELIG